MQAPPRSDSQYKGLRLWGQVDGKSLELGSGSPGQGLGGCQVIQWTCLAIPLPNAWHWGIRCLEGASLGLHLPHLPPTCVPDSAVSLFPKPSWCHVDGRSLGGGWRISLVHYSSCECFICLTVIKTHKT